MEPKDGSDQIGGLYRLADFDPMMEGCRWGISFAAALYAVPVESPDSVLMVCCCDVHVVMHGFTVAAMFFRSPGF